MQQVKNVDFRISLDESNVLKGFAICALLVRHLFLGHRDLGEIAFQISLVCKVCIAIFVFVSGYGLAAQFEKIPTIGPANCLLQTLKFLGRRILKFYLNYWIIFIITVPLGIFVFGRTLQIAYGSESGFVSNVLIDFFAMHGTSSYNATWWFNQLIVYLYVLFPLFFLCGKSRLIGLSVLVLLYVWPPEILAPIERLYAPFCVDMFVFLLGVYCSLHQEFISNILNKINLKLLTALSIALTIFLCFCRKQVIIPHFFGVSVDPYITLFLALSVVSLCRQTSFKLKALVFLGKHSMNIYLLHTFIAGYFFSDFIYSLKHPLFIFAATLGISLLLSIVLEFFKERIGFYNLLNSISTKLKS